MFEGYRPQDTHYLLFIHLYNYSVFVMIAFLLFVICNLFLKT